MKRVWIIIIILLVILIISNDTNDSDELRFRIIGNSNSVVDQNLKMKVARELQTIQISKNNLDIIKKKAEYIVLSNNFTYEVNVCIRNEEFETKYYNNKIIEVSTWKDFFNKICEIVGYISNHYFTKRFKQTTGFTPNEYRVIFTQKHQ